MKPALDKFKHDIFMPLYDPESNVLIDGVDWASRDYNIAQIKPSLESILTKKGSWENEHIIPEFTPISNQLKMGSCASNAVTDMFEILDGLESRDKVEQMSRLWLYWLARYLVGDTDKDKGSYIRANLHQTARVGALLETVFPYTYGNLFPKHVETDLYTMASNNRIKGYYRITSEGKQRADEVELALRTNHPIVFGTGINKSFTQHDGGGIAWSPPSNIDGYHAMLIVGVRYKDNRRQFFLRNSWGVNWGDNGHVWVNEDYITWSKSTDFWVGTKMSAWV